MKANEFVKKFGWDEAKKVIQNIPADWDRQYCSDFKDYGDDEWDHLITVESAVCLIELKRLVESWELVEKHGGLISSKKYLKFLQSSVDIGLYHGLDDVDCEIEIPLMKQAIADVESCQ